MNIINTLGCRLSKQHSTQAMGPDLARSAKPPCDYQGGVSCYMKLPAMEVLLPIPQVYTWARYDNPGTQSIQWDAVYPSDRAPNLWD